MNIFQNDNETNTLKAILNSSLNGIMVFDPYYNENGEIIDFIITMSNYQYRKKTYW